MSDFRKERKLLIDQYLHANEALQWIGRPRHALQRGRIVRAILILTWLGLSAIVGYFVDVTTYQGLGLIGFALALIFFYIFYVSVSSNYLPTGDYYVLTNLRALLLHVKANDVQIESVGLAGISDVQHHPEQAAVIFGTAEDTVHVQFSDVEAAYDLYKLARQFHSGDPAKATNPQ